MSTPQENQALQEEEIMAEREECNIWWCAGARDHKGDCQDKDGHGREAAD